MPPPRVGTAATSFLAWSPASSHPRVLGTAMSREGDPWQAHGKMKLPSTPGRTEARVGGHPQACGGSRGAGLSHLRQLVGLRPLSSPGSGTELWGPALSSGPAHQQGLDPGTMLISQREGPSWGQHIWSLEQQWLQIDWDKHRGVPWGQGAKAEEEGASWQRSSWGQGGAARRTQALGWVPPRSGEEKEDS